MKLFVKDTDGSGRLDGLPHIPWGLITGFIFGLCFPNLVWYGSLAVTAVFTVLELHQEYKIQRKAESRYTWRDRLPHRFQDVWFPVAGYFAAFYLTVYLIEKFT